MGPGFTQEVRIRVQGSGGRVQTSPRRLEENTHTRLGFGISVEGASGWKHRQTEVGWWGAAGRVAGIGRQGSTEASFSPGRVFLRSMTCPSEIRLMSLLFSSEIVRMMKACMDSTTQNQGWVEV